MSPKTKFGYLHGQFGLDMDGTSCDFEWVDDHPMTDDPQPQAGWFAMCEVEPEAGWIGPFDTEGEAVHAATTEEGFWRHQYGDDPLGDYHGRNE